MAKQLNYSGSAENNAISPGLTIRADHVTQSVDALTGVDAYDITVSGSLNITGPTSLTGSLSVDGLSEGGTNTLMWNSSTKEFFYTGSYGGGGSGTNGTSGTDGTSGINGTSGTSGANGTNGTNGTSGINGLPGTNGTNGTSGNQGANGTHGTSGTSGEEGTHGTSGTDGTSGTSGTDGTNGTNGTSGTDGTNGTNGTSGTTGTSGTDGTHGTSGTDGTSGTSGENGTHGTSGTDGTNGTNGTSGINGTNGTNGTSGTTGTSGTDGTHGTSGTAGSEGTHGTSGTTGTSGTSGAGGGGGISTVLSPTVRYTMYDSGEHSIQALSTGTLYAGLSWSQSGTTVTVTSTAHGLTSGDYIVVRGGADSYLYVDISNVSANSFDYTSATSATTTGTDGAYVPAFNISGTPNDAGYTIEAPSAGSPQCISLNGSVSANNVGNTILTLPSNGFGINSSTQLFNIPSVTIANAASGASTNAGKVRVDTSSPHNSLQVDGLISLTKTIYHLSF